MILLNSYEINKCSNARNMHGLGGLVVIKCNKIISNKYAPLYFYSPSIIVFLLLSHISKRLKTFLFILNC